MSAISASTIPEWMSLDELQCMALSQGCGSVEFDRAAHMLGSHPLRVARYLKRHSFLPQTFEIPQGGHFQNGAAA